MPDAEHGLVTIDDAATALDLPASTIRRWAKKGLVRSTTDSDGRRRFPLTQLQSLKGGPGETNRYRILRAPPTAFRVIELFSGCGGLALGFENAGLQTELLVESDPAAAATLRLNWPNKNLIDHDVAEVDFGDYAGEVDVVAGGFPCQAFSYAGQGRGFEDTRGTLFFEFARCIDTVRPKIAIGENVRGLIAHDGGRTLLTMLHALSNLGYDVAYRLHRSHFFDVPQKRERLVILAARRDLQLPLCFPRENDYTISVREALEGCPDGPGTTYSAAKAAVMDLVPAGGNWRDLPEPQQREYMGRSFFLGGGRTGMARRLAWDEPSLTLTCSPAQKQTERCHPSETRPLTCREYARLQTFPDSWQFSGSVSSQYRQIGNAVPVNLAFHIGRCAIAMLRGEPDPASMEEVQPLDIHYKQMSLDL